ncbi:uncharacterized protein HMPREF1541_08378 [Cyphellophora europaea CBS 101466]|uniref:Uncharacterized protein n=1 Tax=Cyphellophora europaea (strain CBS 101466) TaxID=1220924 RepID=W2RLQ1_CYPE1|nr:uncharacterized protein HMPREF1541_08378 [Cyphellophora europaea CBS 101466]ETN37387.1 hypothetical protein HMPREF1541_08378 [Cyphellophora europaea CBS 101466]
MAATKTTFFGSMFAFEPAGVDDIIDTFRECYADSSDDAPFMSYDHSHHVFKIEKLDVMDDDTPIDVLRQLQHYTLKQAEENELIDPKLRPLEGFLARLATEYSGFRAPDLLDIDFDEHDERHEDALGAMQHAFTEWHPVNDNIKILTRAVAESVLALTGTEILPEPTQNQVRLVHGNFDLALQKLKNLEPLLELQYQQRDSNSARSNGNVLVTTDDAIRPLLGFQKVDFQRCPAFDRVIVPPHTAQNLAKKYLCEGRILLDGILRPHPNLDTNAISPTNRHGGFSLWDDYKFKEAGNRANMEPRSKNGSTVQGETVAGPTLVEQKYLQPSKAAELVGWAVAVDSVQDPNVIEPDAPAEPASRRRRRVAADSDDEEEAQDGRGMDKETSEVDPGYSPSPGHVDESITSPTNHSALPCSDDYAGLEDDGELLPGLPVTISRYQAHVAPSVAPSNLLSLSSDVAKSIEFNEHPVIPDPAPRIESPRRRRPKAGSDSEDDGTKSSQRLPEIRDRDPYCDLGMSSPSRALSPTTRSFRGSMSQGAVASHLPPSSNAASRSATSIPQRGRGKGQYHAWRGDPQPGISTSQGFRPPPGFGGHNAQQTEARGQQPNFLDDDLVPVAGSDIPRIPAACSQRSIDQSSKFWENHTRYTGLNVDARAAEAIPRLREQIELEAAIEASKESTDEWSTVQGRARQKKGSKQRKATRQEPHFHQTMDQKAGNRGKKRGGKKQNDFLTERQKRQKAIEDAYGPAPATSSAATASAGPAYEGMSKGKKKLLSKNGHMACANGDAVQQELRVKETEGLKNQLRPLFEHSRAFSGRMVFGIHLGQVLLSADPEAGTKGFDSKTWYEVFGSNSAVKPPLTYFTPVITTNGADVDRILEARSPLGSTEKLFDRHRPGPSSVCYEFHCQSKNGENFLLVVREDLTYEIRNSTANIGMVCMQCPAQVWDACAILQGAEFWHNPPLEIQDTVERFVSSIHIAPGRGLSLYFQQPSGNILTIKSVQMKRVSLHECLLPEHEGIQLRVTEQKTLCTRVSPSDKRLWKALEYSYEVMVQQGFVHYEMCLVDTTINSALEANQALEVGELTDAATTGKSLLKDNRIRRLLDTTVTVLTKIDFVGMHNYGTMRRQLDARIRHEQSLPPGMQSQIHPLIPASRVPASVLRSGGNSIMAPPGSVVGSDIAKPIHGTRMNTRAEVVVDEQGNYYQKGLGGAIVPVAVSAMAALSEAPLGPEDSASQKGAARRAAGTQPVGTGGIGSPVKSMYAAKDSKPPGFW